MIGRPIVPVAIIIVNFHSTNDILCCLDSLATLSVQPLAIMIVDNSYTDSLYSQLQIKCKELQIPLTTSVAASLEPTIIYSYQGSNNGFAAANNSALNALIPLDTIEYFWLLNPDTTVDAYALEALLYTAATDQNIAIVGSTLVKINSLYIQAAAGARYNPVLGTTSDLLRGISLLEVENYSTSRINVQLSYINGASMLIRKEIILTVGKMKEFFFLYYEETEWCLRIRSFGYSFAWSPKSIVYHKEGGSINATSIAPPPYVDYLMLRNRLLVLREHYPYMIPIAVLSYGLVAIKRILRKQPNRLPLVWRAIIDGLRGKSGKPDGFTIT